MSITTSTFYLQVTETSTVGSSTFSGNVTIPVSPNNVITFGRTFSNTSVTYSYTLTPPSDNPTNNYTTIVSLVKYLNTIFQSPENLARTPVSADNAPFVASNFFNVIRITSTVPFSLVAQTGGAHAALGFGTAQILSTNSSILLTKSFTFPPIDFYPPSTISDTNVFMRLVNIEMFGLEFQSDRIPYLLFVEGLPQPVGTYSDAASGCRNSTLLGMFAGRSSNFPGPRILTHIPDGLQQLTFRFEQLYKNDRTQRIIANTVLGVTIEFEVSTHK